MWLRFGELPTTRVGNKICPPVDLIDKLLISVVAEHAIVYRVYCESWIYAQAHP